MNLKEYRDKYKLKNADLARLFKINPSSISHWITGRAKPHIKNALKIYKATKGEVTLEELGSL